MCRFSIFPTTKIARSNLYYEYPPSICSENEKLQTASINTVKCNFPCAVWLLTLNLTRVHSKERTSLQLTSLKIVPRDCTSAMHKGNYSVAAGLFAPNSANKKICFAPTEAFLRGALVFFVYFISQAAGQSCCMLCRRTARVEWFVHLFWFKWAPASKHTQCTPSRAFVYWFGSFSRAGERSLFEIIAHSHGAQPSHSTQYNNMCNTLCY